MLKTKLLDLPEDERPREKLLNQGAPCLSTSELLAILLHSGTRNKSVLALATELLARFKDYDIPILLNNPALVSDIKGIGPAKLATVLAAIELGLRLAQKPSKERVSIRSPEQVADYVMPLLRYKTKEYFYILLLDTKKQVISFQQISIGSLNASIVHPREVFHKAIEHSASTIILVHNHPSGDPTPSREDMLITKKLVAGGRLLSIEVIDHIIVGDNKFTSLKAQNMLE